MNKQVLQRAFTIVELIIVIVVIGILAATTLVAYPMMQNEAKDIKRKEGATKIANAIEEWSLRTGKTPADVSAGEFSSGSIITTPGTDATCPGSSYGSGFFYSGWDGSHPCTMQDILEAYEYMPDGYVDELPPNPKTERVQDLYFLSVCNTDPNRYALLYSTSEANAQNSVDYNQIFNDCGLNMGTDVISTSAAYQLNNIIPIVMAQGE